MAVGRALAAKVRVPRIRALPRERLDAILRTVWDHGLGLVVAPAGSGKTTLLAHFVEAAGVPAAWYRPEPSDATEQRLVAHLAGALSPVLGEADGDWQSVDDVVAALEGSRSQVLVVIDEMDALWGTEAEAAVERLVEYLPPGVAVLAAARRFPNFDLTRLRVQGRLLELGPEDLRFRFWEVEDLFRDLYQEPLPPHELAELTRRTEGWAAGLQLFHLATRNRPARDRAHLLAELGRRSRLLGDYLTSNVLAQLPDDLRRFLVDTSVLVRLTPALCDALTGRDDSARVLEELEHARLFTHRTGDDSFRYHEVLRAHLEATLVTQLGPEQAATQFRRAGALLEADGAVPDALRAYGRAEDWDAITRLLGGQGEHAVDAADDWIDLLPPAIVDSDPWLLLGRARRSLALGRWDAAADTYGRAEQLFGPGGRADLCRRERSSLQAWLAPVFVAPPDWTGLVRRAVQRDPAAAADAIEPTGETRAGERLASGLARLLAGDVTGARHPLSAVVNDPAASPTIVLGAEVADVIAAALAGHVDLARLDDVADRAETAGLAWLATVVRGARQAEPAALPWEKADGWGPAVATLLAGLLAAAGGPDAAAGLPAALDEASSWFRGAGAGVLDAWARAAAAVLVAQNRGADAIERARQADSAARAVGAPGASALAAAALVLADGRAAPAHLARLADLTRATGIDLRRPVAQSLAVPPARLVGRDPLVGELDAYLAGALRGVGRTVLLTGAAGIGKTRLAEHVAQRAHTAADVLWGRCSDGTGPYWAWTQVLRAHLLSRDLVALGDELTAGEVVALSRVVPELPELLPTVDGAGLAGVPEPDATAVHQAVMSLLERAARRRPLVIVLEDLHVADEATLGMLQFASRMVAAGALLLVGTVREVAHDPTPAITSVVRLRLGGLADDAVRQLVQHCTGEEPSAELAMALGELSGGNPFFVQELARQLVADHRSGLADLRPHDVRIPSSLRDLIMLRLEGVGERCRDVLDLAAVAGRSFKQDVVERMAGGWPGGVAPQLHEAAAAGLLRQGRGGPGWWEFADGLVREALYDVQDAGARASRQRQLEAIVASAQGVGPRSPVRAADTHGGTQAAVLSEGGAGARAVVRCLGTFALSIDGSSVELASVKPRVRSLLRLLALHGGRAVHREQLVEALWGGVDGATRNLQVAVSSLRQLLEPGVGRGEAAIVVRDGDSYRLALPKPTEIDVRLVEEAVAAGSMAAAAGNDAEAAVRFGTAVELYTGEVLEEEGPADWVVGERERVRGLVTGAAERAADLALRAGDAATAVAMAERGLAIDRFRDGLWLSLIEAHVACGSTAAAQRARDQYHQVLEELGVA